MDPKFDKIIRLLNGFWLGNKKTLENVGQMSNIKFIMEVNGSLSEVSFDFSVKVKSSLNDWDNLFLNSTLELREMLAQESVVNSEQRGLFWERNG